MGMVNHSFVGDEMLFKAHDIYGCIPYDMHNLVTRNVTCMSKRIYFQFVSPPKKMKAPRLSGEAESVC